jgi:hypothetical protein
MRVLSSTVEDPSLPPSLIAIMSADNDGEVALKILSRQG